MSEPIDAVDDILRRLKNQVEKSGISDSNRKQYIAHIEGLNAAKDELLELRNRVADLEFRLQPLPQKLGNLADLPKELIDELAAPKGDELENQIIEVIRNYGGTADLDQILVGLYRKFDVVQKRRFTQNKIWRMSQKDIVWSVKGKKGVYTVNEPDPADKVDTEFEPEDDRDDPIPF